MVESAGWERALWFEANAGLAPPPHEQRRDAWASRYWSPAIGREHHATRTAAGIFDLTPFTKVEVEGAGAVDWLNRVCASEMDRPVGRIVYTTVLTHGRRRRLRPHRDARGRGSLPRRHRRRLGPARRRLAATASSPTAAACACAT